MKKAFVEDREYMIIALQNELKRPLKQDMIIAYKVSWSLQRG